MSQRRLTNLGILSIEKNFARRISYEEVIENFRVTKDLCILSIDITLNTFLLNSFNTFI